MNLNLQLKEPTFDVMMLDGRIVQIKSPDGNLIKKMEQFEKRRDSLGVDDLYKLALEIINFNDNFMTYTLDDILGYSVTLILKMIVGYSSFIESVKNNPN